MVDNSANSQVGKVVVVTGGAFLETPKGLTPLVPESPVYRNSVIVTKAGGHVEVKFTDGTVMSQGANAKMAVDNYVFDSHGSSPSSLLLNMGQGAFRVITGKIATQNPENFNVKTPLATIGIRGTDFSIETGPNGDLILVGKISPDHILVVEDHFGTVRFVNYAGMVVVVDGQHGITGVHQATPEEIDRIQNGNPVTSFDYHEEHRADDHAGPPAQPADTDHGAESHGHGTGHGHSDTELFNPFGDYHGVDVYHGQDGYHGLLDDPWSVIGGVPDHGGDHLTDHFSDALYAVSADTYDPLAGGGAGGGSGSGAAPEVFTDIYGTPGPDVLNGTSGNDHIYGLASDDVIHGNGGNDSIYGMDGNDTLFGDAGNDSIYGGAGHDTLSGGDGNDLLSGGTGNDLLAGGPGNDILFGGPGHDVFSFAEMGPNHADAIMDFAKHLTASMSAGQTRGDYIQLQTAAFPGLHFSTGSNHVLQTLAAHQVTGTVPHTHTLSGNVTNVTYYHGTIAYQDFFVVGGEGGLPGTSAINQHYTLKTVGGAVQGTGSAHQPYLVYFNTNGKLCYDPDGGHLNPGGTIAVLNTVNGGHPTGTNLNLNIHGTGAGLTVMV